MRENRKVIGREQTSNPYVEGRQVVGYLQGWGTDALWEGGQVLQYACGIVEEKGTGKVYLLPADKMRFMDVNHEAEISWERM